MPRLQGLEDRGINIQRLAVPEVKKERFVWDPKNYITRERWNELILYLETRVASLDRTHHIDAIFTASTMATLFPERKTQIPISRELCEVNIKEYIEAEQRAEAGAKDATALIFVQFLSRVRQLYPELVDEAVEKNKSTVTRALQRIILVEKSTGSVAGSWQDAAYYSIATQKFVATSNFNSQIFDVIDHCKKVMARQRWWLDANALMYVNTTILPIWIFAPHHIHEVALSSEALRGIHEYMVVNNDFSHALLEDVFKLTLLVAEDVRSEEDGLHIELPQPKEVVEQVVDEPPARREF